MKSEYVFITGIEKYTGLKQITDIFLYGSRAYGTFTPSSDYDFIVIAKDATNGKQFNNQFMNITEYTPEHFQEKLNENKPFSIECFMLPEEFKLLNKTKFVLKLNNYKQEYLNKIQEDKEKLTKDIKITKRIKILLFIKKLELQLDALENENNFNFHLQKHLQMIRKEVFNSFD